MIPPMVICLLALSYISSVYLLHLFYGVNMGELVTEW